MSDPVEEVLFRNTFISSQTRPFSASVSSERLMTDQQLTGQQKFDQDVEQHSDEVWKRVRAISARHYGGAGEGPILGELLAELLASPVARGHAAKLRLVEAANPEFRKTSSWAALLYWLRPMGLFVFCFFLQGVMLRIGTYWYVMEMDKMEKVAGEGKMLGEMKGRWRRRARGRCWAK